MSDEGPGHPPALWARLRELGVVVPGTRVLEVGAGSGQATTELQDAGAQVTALEPGSHLAADLAARLPDVQVVPGRVEEARLPEAAYDAVVAATSLHWLDLSVTLPRLRRAVVDDGLLAVWWTVVGDPAALDERGWREVLASTGHWLPFHAERFTWSVEVDGAVEHLVTTLHVCAPA